jgi:hypothetical protein
VAADVTVSGERPIFIYRESLSTAKENYKTGIQVRTVYVLFFSYMYILIPRYNFPITEYFIAVLYTITRHHNQIHFSFLSLFRNIKTPAKNNNNKKREKRKCKTEAIRHE